MFPCFIIIPLASPALHLYVPLLSHTLAMVLTDDLLVCGPAHFRRTGILNYVVSCSGDDGSVGPFPC